MMTIIVYALLSTALFYLGSRALITRPLWSRYPSWLAAFMDCAACTGFWWGLVLSLVFGDRHELDQFLQIDQHSPINVTPMLMGLISIVTTTIVSGLMQRGFDYLGSAIPPDDEAS